MTRLFGVAPIQNCLGDEKDRPSCTPLRFRGAKVLA